jgi:serine/threonine-protein kinase
MLTGAGAAKLIDFGVARATLGAASGTNAVTGKLSFMAPEQIRGREFDRRADLFSLGIVLYLLSTGQHPFPGKTPREIMQRIRVGEKPRPPSQLLPGYPPALERVVLSALEHSPENRFATASEMANELLRATPERADEPALAAFVEKVCSAELDVKRRAIARALSLAPSSSDSQKFAVSTPPPSSRRLPASEAASAISSTLPATVVTAPIPAPLENAPPRRGKLLGASLFVAAALAGFLASNFDRFRPPSGEAGVPHPGLEPRAASAAAAQAPAEHDTARDPAANPSPAAETAFEPESEVEPEPERRVDKPAKHGAASARPKPARPAAASPARPGPAPAQKPARKPPRALKDTERDAVQRYGI